MEKLDVTYSLWWQAGLPKAQLARLLSAAKACGMTVGLTVGKGEIVNLNRVSNCPAASARPVLSLILDEVRAQGIGLPTNAIVFTPHDDKEIYFWEP